jgi:hypothetical protein
MITTLEECHALKKNRKIDPQMIPSIIYEEGEAT